jgi:2-polyprenyl-6-methoxyphenol hydroxylase-like FAD-dependent oxidoreductase
MMYDVVVVGNGPVGQTATALLAQQGLDVAVFERFSQPYGLPRAVRFDHEAMRIWQRLGITDELLEDIVPVDRYQWFGADGDPIVEFHVADGVSGWPFAYVFFQPRLEAALDRVIADSGAEVNRGWSLASLAQHDDHVALEFRPTEDVAGRSGGVAAESGGVAERSGGVVDKSAEPAVRRVLARYVVGADGARSTTRDLLGIECEDLGFSERWFVVDLRPTDPALRFPEFPQQFCDPGRPHMWAPNGRRHRRWEFMLLPGEEAREFDNNLERVWEMLEPWISPDQGEIVRHAVYEFECKLAATMRSGRCLLAGDAAHVMPPHMGEGLCSGLRDANSLAWRLRLILAGTAGEHILESYSSERLPHVRELVEQSLAMGRASCMLDLEPARQRDREMRAGGGAQPWPFPGLGDGLRYQGPGAVESPQGRLSVQGVVDVDGRRGRLDDVVGSGFQLILGGSVSPELLSSQQRAALADLGCRIVTLGEETEDVDGALGSWLRSEGAAAILVRPDFYVFGAVETLEDLPHLIGDLISQLVAS